MSPPFCPCSLTSYPSPLLGSQTSKLDTAIEACLADFPEQERAHILNLFDRLSKGSVDSSEPTKEHNSTSDADSIAPKHFNAYFSPLLPPPLLTCFRVTMQLHSTIHVPNDDSSTGATEGSTSGSSNAAGGSSAQRNRNRRSTVTRSTSVDSTSPISKYGWIMTIHRLSKTSIEEQAGLSFMLQTHDKSLESFVSNVTRAVMAFWLAGEVKSWKDIPEEDAEATTEYLLTRHLDSSHSKRDSLDDLDLALGLGNESKKTTESPEEKATKEWLETARKRDSEGGPSSKELSRSAFLTWYARTVEYQILFTILIQNLFLGASTLDGSEGKRIKLTSEKESKLCQKNYIAPRIRGLDTAPHFSRLLTVSEFFQLRYALPAPAYENLSGPIGSSKKHGSGGHDQDLSEVRPTPPLQLLFSSKTSGASFSTLVQKIMFQGPTLVIMKDEDGYIFGAYADQDWEQKPKFYGSERTFLFTIRPKFRIYRPSGVNNNFQYLDFGTKTLPNGNEID